MFRMCFTPCWNTATDCSARTGYTQTAGYEQNGAAAHGSKDTKNILNAVSQDRWITDWPANSPDLSWMKNTWAWAEGKLHCTWANYSKKQLWQRYCKACEQRSGATTSEAWEGGWRGSSRAMAIADFRYNLQHITYLISPLRLQASLAYAWHRDHQKCICFSCLHVH